VRVGYRAALQCWSSDGLRWKEEGEALQAQDDLESNTTGCGGCTAHHGVWRYGEIVSPDKHFKVPVSRSEESIDFASE